MSRVQVCPGPQCVWGPAASGVVVCPGSRCVQGHSVSGVQVCPGSQGVRGPAASGLWYVQGPGVSRATACPGSRCVQGRRVSGVPLHLGLWYVQGPGVSRVTACPGSRCVKGRSVSGITVSGVPFVWVAAPVACHPSYPDSLQPQPFHELSLLWLAETQTWEGSIASHGMHSSLRAPEGRGGVVLQRAARHKGSKPA